MAFLSPWFRPLLRPPWFFAYFGRCGTWSAWELISLIDFLLHSAHLNSGFPRKEGKKERFMPITEDFSLFLYLCKSVPLWRIEAICRLLSVDSSPPLFVECYSSTKVLKSECKRIKLEEGNIPCWKSPENVRKVLPSRETIKCRKGENEVAKWVDGDLNCDNEKRCCYPKWKKGKTTLEVYYHQP